MNREIFSNEETSFIHKRTTTKKRRENMKREKLKVKIIPLGGLNEIGKNLTVIEFKDDIIVVDCGLKFPDEDMFGIDIVIPDVSYLVKNAEKVRGIFLTHGHEDHIGALPYVLKNLNVPVYGTKLTLGIVETKLKEHGLLSTTELIRVKPRDIIKLKSSSVEFVKTNHSIADSAMMADSTNVERPGYTMSERAVGENLKKIFVGAKGRIIIATFASNIHRIQQIVEAAEMTGRKIAVSGRSMENIVQVAIELGYLTIDKESFVSIDSINKYPNEQVTIITTGSQGEPMSALARMASSEHKKVNIIEGDTVILSATPIPGNEKLVSKVINQLFKKGAEVVYGKLADVHVSGHACQEELKLMQALVKPKFFIPVHGEYRHLKQHAELAVDVGLSEKNFMIAENGDVIEITRDSIKKNGSVTSGQIFVDGLGVGDVGNIVLRDRKHLSQDGILTVVVTISKETASVVAGPDIISRGFVYVRESEDLMDEAKEIVKDVLRDCEKKGICDWATMKSNIRDGLRSFLYEKTKRKPMILPIIMEI